MLQQKRIAVLIPAYNPGKHIEDAIASLNANDEPHDIVIVDDGSAIPVSTLIKTQPNITVLRLEKNAGISNALNTGLSHILSKHYDYIARLDADDKAHSSRLSIQRSFLDDNVDVLLAGSWGRIVTEEGTPVSFNNLPVDPKKIEKYLYYGNCLFHPSWMMRADVARKGIKYNSRFDTAEDYVFLKEVLRKGKVANIPAYLIDYTVSSRGISQARAFEQGKKALAVQWLYRNFSSIHFYLGIGKTLVWGLGKSWIKSTFFPHSAMRRDLNISPDFCGKDALPVLEWTPFWGLVKIGEHSCTEVAPENWTSP